MAYIFTTRCNWEFLRRNDEEIPNALVKCMIVNFRRGVCVQTLISSAKASNDLDNSTIVKLHSIPQLQRTPTNLLPTLGHIVLKMDPNLTNNPLYLPGRLGTGTRSNAFAHTVTILW